MALDQATLNFLAGMAEAGGPEAKPLWELSPAEARLASGGLKELYGAGPEVRSSTDHVLRGHDGGTFRVRVLQPTEEPTAVVLYLHGGGWVLEDLDGYDTLGRQLAQKSGAAVVLAEYRKAPEHPFPIPVEDAWTALEWTAAHAVELAGGTAPLFVAGDSAGGTLAAVVARRARDAGGPDLAGQILVYPATDADLGRPSYAEPENQTFLTTEFMQWFWDHYLPDRAMRGTPDASPLRAESLADLPPALVITGEHDVLRDEGEAYADRLRAEHVAVEHHRWPGQMHAFFSLVNVLPASAEALELIAGKIRGGSVAI
jgi:acetyl esterase